MKTTRPPGQALWDPTITDHKVEERGGLKTLCAPERHLKSRAMDTRQAISLTCMYVTNSGS